MTLYSTPRLFEVSPGRYLCVGSRWDGWVFRELPDGRMAPTERLEERDVGVHVTFGLVLTRPRTKNVRSLPA